MTPFTDRDVGWAPWSSRLRATTAACALAAAIGCSDETGTGLPEQLSTCAFGEAQLLNVGEVMTLGAASSGQQSLCVQAQDGGQFGLVSFVAADRDTLLAVNVTVQGGGFVDPVAPNTEASDGGLLAARGTNAPAIAETTEEFHLALRHEEAQSLRGFAVAASTKHERGGGAEPVVPAIGSSMELNVSATCSVLDRRVGDVIAVSEYAIFVEDRANPAGGFTTADYSTFAARFDALVAPSVYDFFGQPSDVDDNERVVVFITRGVNEKSPFGGAGVVAGFFWAGDLFAQVGPGGEPGCASSNEREIIYIVAPEPNGEVSGNRLSTDVVREIALVTMGHELQHLLNASRRLFVSDADAFEESWLNEGLSFIAEEEIFYRASGLAPGMNLGSADIERTPAIREAFNEFGVDNLGRYNLYVQDPHNSSPMSVDRLTTRGAAWSFLRYLADRDPRPDREFFRAILDSPLSGLANLEAALGDDPVEWMADWSVAVLADDWVPDLDPKYTHPSWDLRGLVSSLRLDAQFPLRVIAPQPGGGFTVRLRPAGAAAYTLFGLEPGGRAIVQGGESTANNSVRWSLVRLR